VGFGQGPANGRSPGLASNPVEPNPGRIPAQAHEFSHAEWAAVAHTEALGQVGHLVAHQRGQLTFAPEPPAQQPHLAAPVGKDAEQGLHQATFAGTVGTDQGGIALGRQIKADVLHCHGALPADRQPADFENHFRHQPSLPSVLTPDQGAKAAARALPLRRIWLR